MKNKLLQCFRPDNSNFVDDRGFSTRSLSSNGDATITKTKQFVLERSGSTKGSGKETLAQKRKLIRSFSRTVRPAFFEISLKKKPRKRKPSQLTDDSKSIVSCRNDLFSDNSGSQSSTTESSSASSPTSTTSSNTSPTAQVLTEKRKVIKTVFVTLNNKKQASSNRVSGNSSSNVGLFCVLTMCLGIILFYGRICAVIFTTLCLHLFYRPRNDDVELRESQLRTSPSIMELSASNYRKRIIMEGMLKRNNLRRI